VGKSVLKLRDDLLVLHLQPHACPLSSARSRGLQGWQHYASNAIDEVQKSRSSSSSGSKRGAGSSNSSDRKSASMADPDYPVVRVSWPKLFLGCGHTAGPSSNMRGY